MKLKTTGLIGIIAGFSIFSFFLGFAFFNGNAELNSDSEYSDSKYGLMNTSGQSESTTSSGLVGTSSLSTYQPTLTEQGAIDMLSSFQEAYRVIAKKVLPSVVYISTTIKMPESNNFFYFGPPRNQQDQQREAPKEDPKGVPGSIGSGIIFRQDGETVYVLTNFHVVGDSLTVEVRLDSGKSYEGRFIGGDERRDIALVSFQSKEKLPVLPFATGEVYPGDIVFAVGSPFGFSSSITQGIVSAVGRDLDPTSLTSYIQTDTAINQGNSGGALVNIRGELIGMNTLIYSTSGSSAGVGFAIPITSINPVLNELIANGKVEYGWLGIVMSQLDESYKKQYNISADTKGVVVNNVIKGSPAMQFGVLPGDLILSINGKPVENTSIATNLVAGLTSGNSYEFKIIRDGKPMTLNIKIANRTAEQENADAFPGFSVVESTKLIQSEIKRVYKKDIPDQAVLVGGLIKDSSATAYGIEPYDQITQINGKEIKTLKDFYSALAENKTEYVIKVKKTKIDRELSIIIQK